MGGVLHYMLLLLVQYWGLQLPALARRSRLCCTCTICSSGLQQPEQHLLLKMLSGGA